MHPRPLVVPLNSWDCMVEMPILKDMATVACSDVQSMQDIHKKELNEAMGALIVPHHQANQRRTGEVQSSTNNHEDGWQLRHQVSWDQGITARNVPTASVEQTTGSTMYHILNLYLWTI